MSVSYMHAFSKEKRGKAPPFWHGFRCQSWVCIDLKMYQNSLGIAYGWKM